ncbi:hypothetical protein DICVIV_13856 [Dictyocaulus viviparus]|uniref:Kinesin motor domain-containing protein n=1 Tax=Dictyocaulus viviparus TaxID=29172 RepID=A0A0D8X6S5_DICVI|nr:hypothetical protein DICVIV_13856 [Dictyocaulus viviparus]
MEGDRATPRPEPLGNRSNIRRPITAKDRPSVSSSVQATRNHKRRSIGNLRSRTSGTPAKRNLTTLDSYCLLVTNRIKSYANCLVIQRLPDTLIIRRATTLALIGNESRYLQKTEHLNITFLVAQPLPDTLKTGRTTLAAIESIVVKGREIAIPADFDSKLTIFLTQLLLHGEIRPEMLEDLGVYQETFYLEAESVRMKNESVGRLRNIECLLSDLSRKRDELREKDEEIRLAHDTVVDLKGKLTQTFEFQRVYGPNMSQAHVFNDVQELITVIVILGEGDSEGLIPRAVKFFFLAKDKLSDLDWRFEFKASFAEMYNEEVYDLLAERKKLELKMGASSTAV